MKAEFTAIIEAVPGGGYWAVCPEIPGANGQGETIAEAKNNLQEAIKLDMLRGLPEKEPLARKILKNLNTGGRPYRG